MAPDTVIRSRSNPLIQRVDAALRGREPQTIVLEGDRLIDDALRAGVPIEIVLVADSRASRAAELADEVPALRLVDADLLQRVSRLTTSPGVLALCPTPRTRDIASWRLDARSLVLVAVGVGDPGNLGALARSAEALGAQALVFVSGASPWSSKALRGSMGSLLRMPVSLHADASEAASELARRGVRQVRSATRGGLDPAQFDWSGPLALWISGETGDLPAVARAFDAVTIPMAGRVESLNVTVATSLLLYASGRTSVRAEPADDGRG